MSSRAHVPQVSARIEALIVQVAAARGVDAQRLMAGSGFKAGWLVDAEARMPPAVEERLWDRAAELTADPLFGLHAAAAIHPGAFGVLDYGVRTAHDLRTAPQRLARGAAEVRGWPASGLRRASAAARRSGRRQSRPILGMAFTSGRRTLLFRRSLAVSTRCCTAY